MSNGYGAFPANEVDEAVGRYIADTSIPAGNKQVKERLADISREIRRRF